MALLILGLASLLPLEISWIKFKRQDQDLT